MVKTKKNTDLLQFPSGKKRGSSSLTEANEANEANIDAREKKEKWLRIVYQDTIQETEIQQKNKETKSTLILDSNRIWKIQPFSFAKMNKEKCGVGLLLPKMREVFKDKQYIGMTQEDVPYIITDKGEIKEITPSFEEKYKIKYEALPSQLELRWQLEDINRFTEGHEPENPLSIIEVFNQITKEYDDYITTQNKTWHKVQALWDIGTYFFLLFDFFPIIELRGFKQSGKTKIMKISRMFTFNASPIMTNPTASSLFRETHEKRFTKYIDEAEKIWRFNWQSKKEESDERAELLNSSVSKGSMVPRSEPFGRSYRVKYFSVYSPTMLASIFGLKGATEDRAIIRVCVRNPMNDKRGDIEPNFTDFFYQEIRNHLYRFLLLEWKKIEKEYMNFDNDTKLRSRDFMIWKPLLVIAKVINGETLYNEIKKFAEKQSKVKHIETIDESTNEYKIIMKTYELLKERSFILLNDIGRAIDHYNPLHSKTISGKLDKLGLREYKEHNEEGNGYAISQKDFVSLIQQTHPNLLLFPSFASFPSGKQVTIEEEIIDNEKTELKQTEANKKKLKETLLIMDEKELIHLKCFYCDSTPCVKFNRIGKPTCANCLKDPNIEENKEK